MSTDFAIEWDVALERLAEHLEPASLELVEGYAGRCAEDEVVLWIDEPWHELDYETMAADAPVALAVFAGGLKVESAACFSAPDASTFIASHLVAPCVVSGNSDGGASILGKANVDVDVVVGSIEGGPRTLKTLSLNDAYRRWSAELEDGTRILELFVVAFDDGQSVGP